MRIRQAAALAVIGLSGCAGRLTYAPPAVQPPIMSDTTIAAPYAQVWKTSTQKLAAGPWVIERQDPTTGLMVLHFTGNPERYLDCGTVESDVTNPRAQLTRHYRFPGSSPHQSYEQIVYGNLYDVDRAMEVAGTINVLFKASGARSTRAQVNAHYVVTRTVSLGNTPTGRFYAPIKDTVAFSSGSAATLPGPGRSAQCVATGALERDVLAAIH